MGFFSSNKKIYSQNLGWINIDSVEKLENIFNNLENQTVLFFKHSTRCPVSRMVLNVFEKNWTDKKECKLYFIDLLTHRNVSNKLSHLTSVEHQSPQTILIKNKQVVYHNSHNGISAEDIQNLI
ncbi:MAG: bacillithiol system redox-active protein YtxJ [Brumimicrobium sp.]